MASMGIISTTGVDESVDLTDINLCKESPPSKPEKTQHIKIREISYRNSRSRVCASPTQSTPNELASQDEVIYFSGIISKLDADISGYTSQLQILEDFQHDLEEERLSLTAAKSKLDDIASKLRDCLANRKAGTSSKESDVHKFITMFNSANLEVMGYSPLVIVCNLYRMFDSNNREAFFSKLIASLRSNLAHLRPVHECPIDIGKGSSSGYRSIASGNKPASVKSASSVSSESVAASPVESADSETTTPSPSPGGDAYKDCTNTAKICEGPISPVVCESPVVHSKPPAVCFPNKGDVDIGDAGHKESGDGAGEDDSRNGVDEDSVKLEEEEDEAMEDDDEEPELNISVDSALVDYMACCINISEPQESETVSRSRETYLQLNQRSGICEQWNAYISPSKVHFWLMDSFWIIGSISSENDNLKIRQNLKIYKKKIIELFCHATLETFSLVPLTQLVKLGIVYKTVEDLPVIKTVANFLSDGNQSKAAVSLEELHICVSENTKIETLPTSMFGDGLKLFLHFPCIKNSDLPWVVSVTSALVPKCESDKLPVAGLFFPDSSLTERTITEISRYADETFEKFEKLSIEGTSFNEQSRIQMEINFQGIFEISWDCKDSLFEDRAMNPFEQY